MHIDRTSRRILGSLIEKRFSTPEQYPLTLNSLVLACNQKSNRDPFMELAEFTVEGCLMQLRINGHLTVVERDTGRAVRYKERLSESMSLDQNQASVLAELLLRGPQTEQELARRCPRMGGPSGPEACRAILDGFAARKIVELTPRRSGERHARWRHLLAPPGEPEDTYASHADDAVPAATPHTAPVAAPAASPAPAMRAVPSGTGDDVAVLRDEIAALRAEVQSLRAEVAGLRSGRAQEPAADADTPRERESRGDTERGDDDQGDGTPSNWRFR